MVATSGKHSNGDASKVGKPPSNGITIKTVICGALGAVVVYHLSTLFYLFYELTKAAAGPFGSTLVVTDEISAKYPLHFTVVQQMAVLPFPNIGAKKYYESQREFFAEAARNFEVHPYWVDQMKATPDMTFREVVTERIRAMHRQFEENGRMDYRLEKDRCAQFDFLRRNNIPHPKIEKVWFSREELLDEVESGAAVEMMQDWPVFFKACHLTQRSSLGTFPMTSPESFQEHKQDLVNWINDKWVYRSRDVDRPWQKEGDALTDELTPSFLIQEPMKQSGVNPHTSFQLDGRVAVGLVEIKVEVIWGRVYIMQMDAVSVFLRNGETEDYGTFMGGVLHRPGKVNDRTIWIRDEGYLDCVIETAERVAHAAHIEYIRVDIFLDRADPTGCVVNEVSLSSGYAYYGHEEYMAKLWAGPLQDKSYKLFNSTTPVYELSTEGLGESTSDS